MSDYINIRVHVIFIMYMGKHIFIELIIDIFPKYNELILTRNEVRNLMKNVFIFFTMSILILNSKSNYKE